MSRSAIAAVWMILAMFWTAHAAIFMSPVSAIVALLAVAVSVLVKTTEGDTR